MTINTPENDKPAPNSPEYQEAMADKYRSAQNAEGVVETPAVDAKPDKPEGVPDKFWNAETGQVNVDALLKSYTELEKTRGAPKEESKTEPLKIDETPAEGEKTAEEAVQNAGLDWESLKTKVNATGTIEETDFAALEKAGIPREIVQDYIGLAKAKQEAETEKAIAYAGGQEKVTELLGWAAKNLSDSEKQTYNAMLASPNWMTAIDVLNAKVAASKKTAGEPTLESGGNHNGGPTGYRSKADMKKDMSDPRYNKDPAFTRDVHQKVRFATWDLDQYTY